MISNPFRLPALAPILRTSEVRAIEQRAGAAPLMERAGVAAADVARSLIGSGDAGGKVLVLAGPGNNGGDAFVAARRLREGFFDVTMVFAGALAGLPPDAAAACRAFTVAGGVVRAALPRDWRGALIVDGIFGIGLNRPVGSPYAEWIAWANGANTPILALDIPSGLHSDTGIAPGPVIVAAATSTFIGLKPGLLTADGPDLCGHLHVHALAIEDAAIAGAAGHRLMWPALAAALPEALRRRCRNVHKGIFGTVAIVGGTAGMIGAPLLAGRAALRVGAGRVRVGFAARSHPSVDSEALELMVGTASAALDSGADVIVMGPGLGTGTRAADLLGRALALPTPLVLDADALSLIGKDRQLRNALRERANPTLLTPHPAEAGRLLGVDTKKIQADRLQSCLEMARTLNAHVVLKGAGSVLAAPDGRWDINASGNPGLSAAGSGDVLAGFAGAMLAQHLEPHAALRYAVCLHGAAADVLVDQGHGPLGMLASELADAARALLNAAAREG